jgi:hypothetical protein
MGIRRWLWLALAVVVLYLFISALFPPHPGTGEAFLFAAAVGTLVLLFISDWLL